nr:nucleoredoxin-like protein 2 [Vulpes vulpes]
MGDRWLLVTGLRVGLFEAVPAWRIVGEPAGSTVLGAATALVVSKVGGTPQPSAIMVWDPRSYASTANLGVGSALLGAARVPQTLWTDPRPGAASLRQTPLLRRFHAQLLAQARRPAPFQVVFVSADGSAREMLDFMRRLHGAWLALPFHDPLRHELRTMYHISVIPRLVVVKPSGEVITDKGRKQIREQGLACFQNWVEAANIFQNFSG